MQALRQSRRKTRRLVALSRKWASGVQYLSSCSETVDAMLRWCLHCNCACVLRRWDGTLQASCKCHLSSRFMHKMLKPL